MANQLFKARLTDSSILEIWSAKRHQKVSQPIGFHQAASRLGFLSTFPSCWSWPMCSSSRRLLCLLVSEAEEVWKWFCGNDSSGLNPVSQLSLLCTLDHLVRESSVKLLLRCITCLVHQRISKFRWMSPSFQINGFYKPPFFKLINLRSYFGGD